jgi:hypothetical protein
MAGFSSMDNFISEVTAGGKFWRQDFFKLYAGGTAVAGNWYDLTQGNGTPCQYLHGNMIQNYDFVAGTTPWIFSGANWTYAAATHSMTRVANADAVALTQYTKCVPGQSYFVTVSATVSAGAFTIALGGTNGGTTLTGTGVVRQVIVCGATALAPLTITPNGTAACTLLDLVSIQPLAGTFIPYNDLTEGALWHGGDTPAGDTKHLINFGAWANFATGLPAVLMLVDMLGVYPRIATDSALVQPLNCCHCAGKGQLIADGQTAFNEQTITNVTTTVVVKATEGVTGGSANASCNKIAVGAAFTTGTIADKVVALGAGYVRAKYVYMWIRSSVALNAGDLAFGTDESAQMASSQDVNLPAIAQDTWTRVRLDVSGVTSTDKDAVISVGFKALVDKGACNIYVDDIVWVLPDGVIANGNFYGNATYWTANANWAYASGTVQRTANASPTTLQQDNLNLVSKCPYLVTYTISGWSAGTVTVSIGGTAGTARGANGEFTEIITAGSSNSSIIFTPDATFNGSISHVTCFAQFPRSDAGTSTSGNGVRMFYVMDNALSNGANAANVVIKYTNSGATQGTSNRMLGGTVVNTASDVVAHLPHSGVAAGKYAPFLPLQAGDYGIQSVESFQFSAAQATANGAVNLCICKPIASIPITTAYVAAERDLLNQLPSLPRVRDGACLMFLVFVGGVIAAGSQFQGYADFGWS